MPVTFVSTSSAAAPAACYCAGARLNIAACALHSPRAPSPSSPAITWADEGAPTQLQHISWDELRQRCMQVAACVAAKYQPGVDLCVWHAWQQLLCITACNTGTAAANVEAGEHVEPLCCVALGRATLQLGSMAEHPLGGAHGPASMQQHYSFIQVISAISSLLLPLLQVTRWLLPCP